MDSPLLKVERLRVDYEQGRLSQRNRLTAVRDVSFTLAAGDTLGIVGESGCGKTTLGRAVLGLEKAKDGTVAYKGRLYTAMSRAEHQTARQEMGLIFQDSTGALNPRKTVLETVAAPLKYRGVSREERSGRAKEALSAAGLFEEDWYQYPYALSGGQRQRVCIARAMVGVPQLLVCDEAVSALDGVLRRQILELLAGLQHRTGAALLFISHDLRAVEEVCRQTAVMYLGRFVEFGATKTLFRKPKHPYTKALLESVLRPDPSVPAPRPLQGEPPSPENPPAGCPFHPRCPVALGKCRHVLPELRCTGEGVLAACHRLEKA